MGLTQKLGTIPLAILTDASNNVGIGAAPSGSYKLEVTGTSNFTGVLKVSAATGFSVGSIAGYRRIEYTGTTFSMLTDADGYAGLSAGAGTFSSTVSATKVILSLGAEQAELTSAFNNDFKLTNSGNFRIINNSNTAALMTVTNAGNVGIGTSSPTAYGTTNLEVNGKTGAGYFTVKGSSNAVIGELAADGEVYLSSKTANAIIIRTTDVERMRISAAGLVTVIGTGSASTAEGIYFKRTSTLDQGGFISGSGGVLNLYATNAYSSLYGTMVFGRYNGTTTVESMRITSDGYVGIGTTAPSIKLSVAQDITNDGDIAAGQFMVCGATTNLKRLVIGYDTNGSGYGYIESAYKDSAWTYTALQPTSGNVVIGTSTDLGYKLGVNGTAYATGAAGALSDIRHKNNVLDINEGLDAVMKLRSVSYLWNEEFITDNGMKGLHYGFIAQEVKDVLPDVVLEQSNEEKTLGLKYNEIIPVLVKAIQELNERLNKAGL